MNNKVIAILILSVIFLGLLFVLTKKKSTTPSAIVTNPNNQAAKLKEEFVTLSKSGFEPQNITIAQNTRVIFLNKSGTDATVNSDNHPTHKLYPELNLGMFSNNSSVQTVFANSGNYTYHNHLNPGQKGQIVVK